MKKKPPQVFGEDVYISLMARAAIRTRLEEVLGKRFGPFRRIKTENIEDHYWKAERNECKRWMHSLPSGYQERIELYKRDERSGKILRFTIAERAEFLIEPLP